jgi:hypothetical protein
MAITTRMLLATLLTCACLIVAAVAWAAGTTLTIHARFDPDKLGAPTNLSFTGQFSSTAGVPPPISKIMAYAPAGAVLDLRGAGTCTAATLEAMGPGGCPADSRAGFGGGIALLELAKEVIHENYTIDLFVAPSENGHRVLLAFVHGASPASVELVVVAREIPAPKPYGFGVNVEVPLIPTLPGATDASVESFFVTFGATNAAYYRTAHGRKALVHVRGLIVPRTCPRGGFPIEGTVDFADGTAATVKSTIPCPGH